MLAPIQRRLLLLSLAAAVGLPTAQRVLRTQVFDASRYYIYFGADGPFAVATPPAAGVPGMLGEPRSTFRAGEWLGYTSDLTVEAGVGLIGVQSLVRMADGREVRREERRLQPGARRQGRRDFFIPLPADLRPGAYELRRRATFLPADRPPVSEDDFKPIPFEVVP